MDHEGKESGGGGSTYLGPASRVKDDVGRLRKVREPFPPGLLYFDADASGGECRTKVSNALECGLWDAALGSAISVGSLRGGGNTEGECFPFESFNM